MYLKEEEDDREKLISKSPMIKQENFDIEHANERVLPLPGFISNQTSIFEKSKGIRILCCCFKCCCHSKKNSTEEIPNKEIVAYYSLKAVAVQSYDQLNQRHEDSLKMLFLTCLGTEIPEDLRSKEWKTVGFQSENPRTDFRGSGYMSLLFIIYFVKQYEKEYKEMIEFEFFLFAVVAIKIVVRMSLIFSFFSK
jgi:hypothetical protein